MDRHFPPPDNAVDIGHGHSITWFGWFPDRDLNPQYDGVPDIDRMGVTIWHPAPDGGQCAGAITFDVPGVAALRPGGPVWQVISLDPLHVEPSVLCRACGDHGFIRGGAWIPS